MERKKLTIWMNHWFSTGYNIANLIKEDKDYDFHLIGTVETMDSLLSLACDAWYLEPPLTGDDYIDFCLNFCKQRHVDVFVPYRNLELISLYKEKFKEQGVLVLVDDYRIVSMLNNKRQCYEYVKDRLLAKVPDYYIVTNADAFMKAYSDLSEKYEKVCLKFVEDKGGQSFRLIDNNRNGYSALSKKQNTRMTLDAVLYALKEVDSFNPIMVMPYLPDEEISVDCLYTSSGTIMIPRKKTYSKVEEVSYDESILEQCQNIMESIKPKCPCNIQFKYLDEIPYFLEINPRMSGGTHMSCLAADINIPDIAVRELIGDPVSWKINKRICTVSQISTPIIFY